MSDSPMDNVTPIVTATKPKAKASRNKPAAKVTRPEELAAELKMSGKQLRGWLRGRYPRPATAKGTSWTLTPAMVTEARKQFGKRK